MVVTAAIAEPPSRASSLDTPSRCLLIKRAMANTKKLSVAERKKAKRVKRREIKAKFESLTKREHKAFRKLHRTDKVTFLSWYRQNEEEKKKSAE